MQIHGKEITTIISDLDGTLLGQEEGPQEQRRELNPAVFGLIRRLEKRVSLLWRRAADSIKICACYLNRA